MPVKLGNRIAANIVHVWQDPEFWGPKGLGCARCHEHPPIIWGLAFGMALCKKCLLAVYSQFNFEQLCEFLMRQNRQYIRDSERREAYAALHNGSPDKAFAYKRKYGVELIA